MGDGYKREVVVGLVVVIVSVVDVYVAVVVDVNVTVVDVSVAVVDVAVSVVLVIETVVIVKVLEAHQKRRNHYNCNGNGSSNFSSNICIFSQNFKQRKCPHTYPNTIGKKGTNQNVIPFSRFVRRLIGVNNQSNSCDNK